MRAPVVLSCCLLLTASAGKADELQLDSGGRVRGELLRDDDRREIVAVDLPGGGRVLVRRNDVARTVAEPPELREYQRRAVTAPDTAETHYQIALWCRERKLRAEFDAHLARTLELDPDHAEARKLLGYSLQNGRWMTRDERMAARGMIRYGSDYRTAQEIELLKRKERAGLAAAQWRKQLARWRRDLDSSDADEVRAAMQSFRQLTNPQAANALVALLKDEQNVDVQELLIEAAAQVEHPATVQTLATLSLKDPRHDIRLLCLDHLLRAQRPGLADIYVRSLSSKDNTIINRAGEALRAVAADETISPLIDALVTQHQIKLGADRPRDTYSMDSRGGFSFGGGSGKVSKVTLKNPAVLSALVEITGQNFQFNKQAWRRWLDTRVQQQQVDLRRDR